MPRSPIVTMRRWFTSSALVLLLLVCGVAWAQSSITDDESLPGIEELQKQLEERTASAGDPPDAAASDDIDALNQAITAVEKLADTREQLEELQTRVEQAPQELDQLEHQLRERQESQDFDISELEGLSLDALEQRLRDATGSLQRVQDSLTRVQSQLLGAQTLPERAQKSIAEAMKRVDEVRLELEDLARRDIPDNSPQRIAVLAEQQLAEAELRLYQQQLNSNTRLRELLQQRSELLELEAAREEAWVSALQSQFDQLRRKQSEQAIADAVQNEPQAIAEHPVIQAEQEANREISQALLNATSKANELVREGLQTRRQLDRVRRMQQGLYDNIESVRGSVLLSRILREQRESLPDIEERSGLADEIADIRLTQFEVESHRESLRLPEQLARQTLEEAAINEALDEETSEALTAPLVQLYRSRRDLIDQLEPIYGEILTSAIALQLNQQQLVEVVRELRNTIDEQLFWVANAQPLDMKWLGKLPAHLAAEWHDGAWRKGLPGNWQRLDAGAWLALPVLLAAIALLMLRRRVKARLMGIHEQIGRLRHDTQLHTPRAILLNLLLAAPAPLVVTTLGMMLTFGGTGAAVAVGMSLLQLSAAWTMVAWARRLLVSDGVARRHFYWPEGYVRKLRSWMLWLGISLAPVLLIAPLAKDAAVTFNEQPISLVILLIGLTGMSVSMAKLILAHVPFFGVKLFRLILGLVMAMVPLALAGAVVYGYVYSALSLVSRFVFTLYLFSFWILVEAAVVRGLAVAARRLAYRRALARRRAMNKDDGDRGLDIVEEPPLDMEQVNQQSLRLSKLILTIGFAALMYLVWADFLTVLSYLDHVVVVEGASGEGADALEDNLSVGDVIVALFTIGMTVMLARNLPGLLEVMVLSRLVLKQGSAYAISSLLSYVIVGTGTVMALATMGVSWDKLQWLVAALGVGLGFGLQEIFANFISGLIILFERPIRIGDTITLGNLTGTVSRIRIRATTVTDFDRKEIIIPNKTFVTDQLINWSLSDSVTRVTLKYGVSHDADRRVVHRLLEQAASENSRVLADPPPEIFFMAYTSSTMEYELRIYVNALGDRLLATDELNGRVGDLFAENGIRIAFDKLDVHIQRAGREGWGTPVGAARELDESHPPPGSDGDPGDVGIGGDGGGGDGGGR
ncbi:mechanosensitive channel MscK [Halomonas cupida]|uniref:mechanosensitive channel MscK n=1 Tax=Halomonas cupida TaxID=44933 RepID=UPI003A91057E